MVKKKILDSLREVTGEEYIELDVPTIEEHGDFTTNVALKLAKEKEIPSKDYAEDLVQKLSNDDKLSQLVAEIKVAGPGFINFYLSEKALTDNLEEILKSGENYGKSDFGKGKTVIVEYSSPNIAKRFGIGHLRSTIIGQAIYNVNKTLGYKTVGENHLGDWGTQFGMIISQIVDQKLDPRKLSIDHLERLYVDFNERMEDEPDLRTEAKNWFKKLEDGDSEARDIWGAVREISLAEFDRIYDSLGVKIDNSHGESFYEDKVPQVLAEIRKLGITRKSEGAEIVEFEDLPPVIVVKSDGTTTYFARDLAAIRYRLDTWKPSKIIYEVGSDQTLYFKQLFSAAKMLGWAKDTELVHVAHGLVRFKEGKMSTRKGTTIKLEDVLQKAVEKAEDLGSKGKAARQVGVSAIKYFDLSHSPSSDIIFDWDKIFVLEGASGPYLQYTYARIKGVLRKGEKVNFEATEENSNLSEEEKILMRYLCRFSGIITYVNNNYSPNTLCSYLYDLSQKFNAFYNAQKIIGSEEEGFRLALTKATGTVLKNGLDLLGIATPDKM